MSETVVEKILEERRTGIILLSLTQPEPWDTADVMVKLQERLNGYIYVIRDGPLVEKFPQYRGKTFKISLVCYYDPPDDVRVKLDRVNQTLAELGIGFEIMQIEVADPARRRDPIKESIVSFFKRLRDIKS